MKDENDRDDDSNDVTRAEAVPNKADEVGSGPVSDASSAGAKGDPSGPKDKNC